MRKIAIGLGIAFLLSLSNSASLASSIENQNLNARIKSLQERLKEFQQREYKDHEEKMVAEEEAIDLILEEEANLLQAQEKVETTINQELAEKFIDEFENRSDVALTVLFHDNDLGERYSANKSFDIIEPPKIIIEDEQDEKQQFYDSLRKKVFQATRNYRMNNQERRHILASLE